MSRLADRVAVVTGGGGGIGKAIGQAFLAKGMKVVLAEVVKDLLDEGNGLAQHKSRHGDVPVGVWAQARR